MKRIYSLCIIAVFVLGMYNNAASQEKPFNKLNRIEGQSKSSLIKNAIHISAKKEDINSFSKNSVSYDRLKNAFDENIWLMNLEKHSVSTQQNKDLESVSKVFLTNNKTAFGITSYELETRLIASTEDEYGFKHLRFNQMFKGIPVWNAEIIFHYNTRFLESVQAKYLKNLNISVTEKISSSTAMKTCISSLDKKGGIKKFSDFEKKLLAFDQPKIEKIIYYDNDLGIKPCLVWHIEIYRTLAERWEYFIDANTSEILFHYKTSCADGPQTANALDLNNQTRTINTYLKTGTHFMIDASRTMFTGGVIPDDPKGAIITLDLKNKPLDGVNPLFYVTSANNTWTDKAAVSAHDNAGRAYEYFKTVHSRNSIDGQGGSIYSVVNVTESNGQGLDNAFWTGKVMCYGNGASGFKPLAGSLDVAGHEMAHGVTEKTASLEYKFQSGAINESMSDIFGVMLDRDDWLIGEDVVKLSSFPSGALRNMQDPHNGGSGLSSPGWQPSHMNEYVNLSADQDNGGVHINSGIVNKAFQLYATAVGKDKAEKVYYRALTVYLTRSSNFTDLRNAVLKSAQDIYGNNATEATQVGIAYDAVGIAGSGGSGAPGEIAVNPGTEFLLVHDASTIDPNSIYIVTNPANITQNDFHPIQTINALQKPSIVDNGSISAFVSESLIPYTLTLQITGSQLAALDNVPDWTNIALSKDGSKIALVTKYIDTAIYVYDFASQQLAKYILYNPTTAQGVSSDGPLYANALEWDYTGENLIYDAYNVLKKSNGQTLDYWDVGIMKVWDNQTNTFGNGSISKLVTALPDGISIGNPSLSKNSPYIGAFDLYNANDNTYQVLCINFETSEINAVFNNNTLGYPNYNKNDNVLAFTTLDINNGDSLIATLPLQSNKIQASGQAVAIINGGKWPVYYANGNRTINVGVEYSSKESNFWAYPNPSNGIINLKFNTKFNGEIYVYDVFGKLLFEETTNSGDEILLNLSAYPKGMYIIKAKDQYKESYSKIIID